MKDTKAFRSAKTGKFVSKKFADENKDTTVKETITKSKKKTMPKKKVEEEVVCKSWFPWKATADFIYVGGIIVLSAFAIGFMYTTGTYFAAVFLGLI